jgi:hypothetical protein
VRRMWLRAHRRLCLLKLGRIRDTKNNLLAAGLCKVRLRWQSHIGGKRTLPPFSSSNPSVTLASPFGKMRTGAGFTFPCANASVMAVAYFGPSGMRDTPLLGRPRLARYVTC